MSKTLKGMDGKVEMAQDLVTAVPLSAFESSIRLTSHPTSKYQRMIIYKAAEWYGIRAIMPSEGVFVVGAIEPINEKRYAFSYQHVSVLMKQHFVANERSSAETAYTETKFQDHATGSGGLGGKCELERRVSRR